MERSTQRRRLAAAVAPILLIATVALGTPALADSAGDLRTDRLQSTPSTATTAVVGTGADSRSVDRLYRAYFLRTPDATGRAFWTARLRAGTSLRAVSDEFARSAEFTSTYGALGDVDYVRLVYRNVLDRAADDAGLTHWVGRLRAGASRGAVMVGFSDSEEFKRSTGLIGSGADSRSIDRLYRAYFLRAPDPAGLRNWKDRQAGGMTLDRISESFAGSREFLDRYGRLSPDAFVDLIYRNVLDRTPDQAGHTHWVNRLRSGASRGAVMVGFSDSEEFKRMAGQRDASSPTSPNPPAADARSSQDPSGTAKFPARHATAYGYEGSGRSGFISTCDYVNTNTVDPIVFPRQRDRSHAHDFFGNTTTDENTTSDSLINAGTTSCRHADDLSAYWTPSAYDGGRQAKVAGTSMYYFLDNVNNPGAMKPYPVGLRMIAGSANATGPQDPSITSFEEHRRAKNNTRLNGGSMITANETGQVTVRVNFPQCWNGKQLDSPDHKSHMAYAVKGSCPSSHPVLLPQLTQFVRYDANGGADFELSSGPWYTAHADFWNAWQPDTLQEVMNHCRTTHCGRVSSR